MDFPEIIASLAPRPVFILAPELDRHADLEQIKTAMIAVKQYYDEKGANNLNIQ